VRNVRHVAIRIFLGGEAREFTFGGGKEQIWGQLLIRYNNAYRKIIAVKMVFARLFLFGGGQKQIWIWVGKQLLQIPLATCLPNVPVFVDLFITPDRGFRGWSAQALLSVWPAVTFPVTEHQNQPAVI